MAKYLCLDCGNVFDSDFVHLKKDSDGGYFCPIMNCCGTPFEIDEMMIEPIMLLNKKGYSTAFCCSGHVTEHGGGYVSFYNDRIPQGCPAGWTKESTFIDGEYTTIRYYFENNENYISKLNTIVTHLQSLMKWIESLPMLNVEV